MERILMKGNEALAQAAINAGCRHFFGYPITPQNELAAYMSREMPKIGGVFIQAESEIGAANMVQGASACGVRAMTSSSSPGISLKTEAISYMAGADLPCVIVNVQRGGPGLGGIQPSQADYWQATKALGHGDFHILVLAPSTVQEMVDLTTTAFDLSDTYRTPSLILIDGMLGQMMEPVVLPAVKPNTVKKDWATDGHQNKREKNIINSLYLVATNLESVIKERFKKYDEIKQEHQMAEEYLCDSAEIVVVSYGATARVAKAAVKAAREQGIKAGCLRPITLWPFPDKAIQNTLKTAKKYLVAEMSMGQMLDDVKLAINCEKEVDFFGRTGGVIPTPVEILNKIIELNGGAK